MTITSTKKKIHLTVKPDSQAEGMTLDGLLAYLQFHDARETDMVSKINFEAWEDYFRLEGLDIDRNGIYITVPIKISLLEGEYGITSMVRVFTTADFAIIGEGSGTVVRFHKYDFVNEPYTWDNGFGRGRNAVAFFSSYLKGSLDTDISTGINNRLTLGDMTVRMEDGKWFPYFRKDQEEEKQEVSLGALLSYANFPVVEISGLDIEAKGNGEVTLMDGEDCPRQKITGCRLYLDNWFDRTAGKWLRQREQGTNLNVRGDNKSVLVAGNTFIKHGNDEVLTFFTVSKDGKPIASTHGNIRVSGSTFTYLDSPASGTDPDSDGDTRPVHINVVLITFNGSNNVKTTWSNVLFTGNTINLEGPVETAVAMNILPGDVCRNVEFAGNHLYHTYRQNRHKPGNSEEDGVAGGARAYVYSNSFTLRNKINGDDLAPGTREQAFGGTSDDVSTPVVFRGNDIHYSQHTRDDMGKGLVYEHCCFGVYGGEVDIIDNHIDGTGAMVKRIENSDGQYGNRDNPVTLFHCFPCEVPGNYKVRISGNEAVKYGVTLSCRPQYAEGTAVDGYSVQMENNTLSDGAAMVLYNVKNSDIAVVRNSFTGCSKETFIQAKYGVKLQADPAVKLSLFQNKIAPGFGLGSYCNVIAADVPKDSPVLTPISEFCFMLNYLPGYAGMSMPEKNTAAQSHISDNLFESNPSSVCGS